MIEEGTVTERSIVMEGGDRRPFGKILAVGRNYSDHVAEMRAPSEPVLFMKPPTAVRLPGEPVELPRDRGIVHHEIELVVWLRAGGSHLTETEAGLLVGAYGLGLDLTLREVQARAKEKGQPWTLAKGFDGSFPLSPFLPEARVGDPAGLRFHLDVNGDRRQEGRAADMLLPVASLLAYISTWITLEAGDLISTGTPAGVGPIEPGDIAVMTLEEHLEQRVVFC